MVIEFLNREIPLYGIFFWAGILLAGVIAIFIAKKNYIDAFDIFASAIYTMVAAMIGSKLLYFIVSWSEILEFVDAAKEVGYKTVEIVGALVQGGFVFYGGFIGGAIGLWLYAKIYKLSLGDFVGVYAVVLPFGHALGRIGCFFGGCCYGIKYDGPCSHTYGELKYSSAPVGVPLFPVQLLEALCLFILFIVLLIVFFKAYNRNSACVYTYAFGYSIIRFALEFLRGDVERGAVGPFSTSQIISMAIFAIAIITFIVKRKRRFKI
ncbi:MAG: prolipoprotein diacylglyceryl transferase [Ruminococcaceae bacterium]|nr:prolipoprotein diacylglyceryl transferase [Oscillospiraceae bacterium]